MKKIIVCLFCLSLINANELLEEFNKYPAKIYQGEIVLLLKLVE